MTHTQDSSNDNTPTFPKEWHDFDVISGIEARQLSDDTYEIRSASHTLILDKVGFDLFRDSSPEGQKIFETWMNDRGIKPVLRTDIRSEHGSEN